MRRRRTRGRAVRAGRHLTVVAPRDVEHCTTTSSPGPGAEARRLCIANATFVEEREGAEIDTQGVGRLEAEDVVLAVTGGTGDYRNARGVATFEFQTDGRVLITYEVDEVNA